MPDFLSLQPTDLASLNSNTPRYPNSSPGSFPSYGPTFQDIMSRLNPTFGGGDTFAKGVTSATPSTGVSPELQTVLDNIRSNRDYNANAGTSEASALASRRGLAGSSVEQFGVDTAENNADRTAGDQSSTVLLADAQRKQQLQDLLTQGYFTRAGQEGQAGTTLSTTGANLTSDEIASLRNMQFQQQQLQLQQQLGQQGIDVANRNIDASKDIANQNGRNQLIGAGLTGVLPSILPSLFPSLNGGGGGNGGGIFNIFNRGGNFNPYAGNAAPGPYAPGMAPSATSFTPGLGGLALAGTGAMALSGAAEKKFGSIGGVVANPIGYQLNKAKDILSNGGNVVSNAASKISSGVASVFPF